MLLWVALFASLVLATIASTEFVNEKSYISKPITALQTKEVGIWDTSSHYVTPPGKELSPFLIDLAAVKASMQKVHHHISCANESVCCVTSGCGWEGVVGAWRDKLND